MLVVLRVLRLFLFSAIVIFMTCQTPLLISPKSDLVQLPELLSAGKNEQLWQYGPVTTREPVWPSGKALGW